jgi:beta-glucuronidase
MLSPCQSATRERTSLDGLWRFVLDPRGVGRVERWWTSVLPGDREMPVPASFNDVVPTREGATTSATSGISA